MDERSRDEEACIGVVLADGYTEEMKFDHRDLRLRRAACSVSNSTCQLAPIMDSRRTLFELIDSSLLLSDSCQEFCMSVISINFIVIQSDGSAYLSVRVSPLTSSSPSLSSNNPKSSRPSLLSTDALPSEPITLPPKASCDTFLPWAGEYEILLLIPKPVLLGVDDPSKPGLIRPLGLSGRGIFSSANGDVIDLGVACCSVSKVGLRARRDSLFNLLGVADIGVDEEDASGDIGSNAKLEGRAIISGLRGRSGNEGTLNSSLMLRLIGAPSVDVGFTNLAIFLGATGILYVDGDAVFVLELDEERDEVGHASMIVCVVLCYTHDIRYPVKETRLTLRDYSQSRCSKRCTYTIQPYQQ